MGRTAKAGQVVRQCGKAGLPLSVTQNRYFFRTPQVDSLQEYPPQVCCKASGKKPRMDALKKAISETAFAVSEREEQQAAFPFDRYYYTGKMFRFCMGIVSGFQKNHEESMKKRRPRPPFRLQFQPLARMSASASVSCACTRSGRAFSSSRESSAVAMGSNTRSVTRPEQIHPPLSSSV